MTCPACNHQNLPGAKFCADCGASLKGGCSSCGAALTPNAKFCHECGTPVAGGAQPGGQPASARKVVSIMFADLAGSTALHERLDPESTRRFMESYYDVARKAVESHGGKVTQFLGDGVLAMFGIPQVAEDDAIRAVRAGVAMQEGFKALADKQREAIGETGLRVAINTGEVVEKSGTDIIGDPVNVAARLQDQGSNGDVVIGESTQRLVSEQVTLELLGKFDLKGRAQAVEAYRVISLEPPKHATVTPFVGREKELARLTTVFNQATETPATKMAVLLGSAGLGKSRLIGEFTRRSSVTATIIQAHCDAAKGATFAPLADAFRKHLALDADASGEAMREAVDTVLSSDEDQKRIATGIVGLLAGLPASPEETFFVVRRFLTALTTDQPVVLVIDDLQWAEPLLFDLVEHLVQWGQSLPLYLLIGARPELREIRSSFGKTGGFVTDVLTLDGLDANAAMQLAAGVIGADGLPSAVAAKVLATSEGNPLFISELIRMLVVEGALIEEDGTWRAGDTLATVEMPPTIHALLASRIERLEPLDRAILERAAVIGRQFSRNAVTALLPNDPTEIDARLEALQRFELIERGTGWYIGDPVLRFHHVLIRDAAYRRLLKGTRSELHAQLADWIEAQIGDAHEHDETIGRHLEDAHRLLGELGPLDEAGEKLGERAASRLATAGRRALEADDVPLAANLLGRALESMQPDHPDRAGLCIDCCEALLAEGEVTTAEQAIEELARLMEDSDRLKAWHSCFVGQHTVLTAPRELTATVSSVSAAAQTLASLEDSAGEAKAHYVHALALSRQGQIGACEAALDQALAAARKADDRRQANTVLAIAPIAALWGPSPVTRASGRCLDVVRVLRITQGAPAVEAVALMCQGVLEALRGRSEAAHRMIESGREMVEELGIAPHLRNADAFAGYVHMLEGDLPAAEAKLRTAYEGLRDLGLGIDAARAAALLSNTLLAQDRSEEAQELSYESEQLAGDDLKAAIAWRGVRAEALAKQGEHEDAIKLARKAVKIAASTDALLDHADARHALSVALREAGQAQEADAEERHAQKLWEEKGATLLLEQKKGDKPQDSEGKRGLPPVSTSDFATAMPEAGSIAPSHRSVVANAATHHLRQVEHMVRAQDWSALRAKFHDDFIAVEHPTGSEHGPDQIVRSYALAFRSVGAYWKNEIVATLGPSLCLTKCRTGASQTTGKQFDVGEYETIVLQLYDYHHDDGVCVYSEVFRENKLGDAIARLYERYAESLPEGPERIRSHGISEFTRSSVGKVDLERFAACLALDIQQIDHRNVGAGTLSGAESVNNAVRALLEELSEDFTGCFDDLLGLGSNGYLGLHTSTGTLRSSGGEFERNVLEIVLFNDDGLVTHWERFEPEHADAAIARFNELTGGEPTVSVSEEQARFIYRLRPGVHPNHMTASNANWVAALAAGNPEREQNALHEDIHELDHATGSDWGREGIVDSAWRLIRSREPFYQVEALATLGPTLSLSTRCYGASGGRSRKYDVGAYEIVRHEVMEGGEDGIRRMESFAEDRLSDAVARLCERYAEHLDGPDKTRVLGIAETVRAATGNLDEEEFKRFASVFAADVQFIDHRTVGTGELTGSDEVINALREFVLVLSSDYNGWFSDLHGLCPQGILAVHSSTGTDRRSGGIYERSVLELLLFNDDGLVTRHERFEPEQLDKARARFEELVGVPASANAAQEIVRRVDPNTASALMERMTQAFATEDWTAARGLLHDDMTEQHHQTGLEMNPDQIIASLKAVVRSCHKVDFQAVPLATLGDLLVLTRSQFRGTGVKGGGLDVGEFENIVLSLLVADRAGLVVCLESFAPDKLGDAIARLYERYAETLPEGPERKTALAISAWSKFGAVWDLEGVANLIATDIQYADYRHAGMGELDRDTILHALRVMKEELTNNLQARAEDVLRLLPNALLCHYKDSGTDKRSGGDFERHSYEVWVFSDEGLLSRWERFELEHRDQAIARFEELTDSRQPATKPEPADKPAATRPERRVTINAALEVVSRVVEATKAHDWPTLRACFSDDYQEHHYPTGSTFGPDEHVASFQRLYRSENPYYEEGFVASLGDSLGLIWMKAGASGAEGKRYSVGAYEQNFYVLQSVNDQQQYQEGEVFADNKLGDAIIRLYERYAESLPEGTERTRAYGIAEIAKASFGTMDYERFVACLAPDVMQHDHHHVGSGTLTGAENVANATQVTLIELAENMTGRADELLGLRPEGLLFLFTNTGTLRSSGGEFERNTWELLLHDEAGLLTHWERFDADHADKALARFDELAQEKPKAPAPKQPNRHFQANAAFRSWERFAAYINARDFSKASAQMADDYIEIHHPTATSYDSDASIKSFQGVFKDSDPYIRLEGLATLGDQLCLVRFQMGASGSNSARYDVGPYEHEFIHVFQLNEQGLSCRSELFASNKLGEAIVRLYERYAESLPVGIERTRAKVSAQGFRIMMEFEKLEENGGNPAIDPDMTTVDYRILGTWDAKNLDEALEHFRGLREVATDRRWRDEAIIALQPKAVLTRRIHSGIERVGGGIYEREFLFLTSAGEDGRINFVATFDVEQEAQALDLFEELTGDTAATPKPAPDRRVTPNQATEWMKLWDAAVSRQDWDGMHALVKEDMVEVDHLNGTSYGRDGVISSVERLYRSDNPWARNDPIATLGQTLGLFHRHWGASGAQGKRYEVGAYEFGVIMLAESSVDGQLGSNTELFGEHQLGDALIRLYERYAELMPEGPERNLSMTIARNLAGIQGQIDIDKMPLGIAADVQLVDHRTLSTWTSDGAEAMVEQFRAQLVLASNMACRIDSVLAASPKVLCITNTYYGTAKDSGGLFENRFSTVWACNDEGRISRIEAFEMEDEDKALARFDELTAATKDKPVETSVEGKIAAYFSNSATKLFEVATDHFRNRDWEAFGNMLADEPHLSDRRAIVRLEIDGKEKLVEYWQPIGDMEDVTVTRQTLATRGERLALSRLEFTGASGDIGPSQIFCLDLAEVNEQGQLLNFMRFDLDDINAAYAELDARFNMGEASHIQSTIGRYCELLSLRDWKAIADFVSDDFVEQDFRPVGLLGTREGGEKWAETERALIELAPDTQVRGDHSRVKSNFGLSDVTFHGTREGGHFEIKILSITHFDANGKICRNDLYEPEQIDEVVARFEALVGGKAS